jgi:hypothetical protein
MNKTDNCAFVLFIFYNDIVRNQQKIKHASKSSYEALNIKKTNQNYTE